MIFAIMLTGTQEDKKLWIAKKFRSVFALGAAGFIFMAVVFTSIFGTFAVKKPFIEVVEKLQTEGTTSTIGYSLLTKYVLPFEVLSILLLAAIVGAVVIAVKDKEFEKK